MLANHDRVTGIVLIVIAVAAFLGANKLPDDTALYPRLISGLMLFLSVGLTARSLTTAVRTFDFGSFAINLPRLTVAVSVTLLYFVAAGWVGFYTATACFVPGMAWLAGYRTWRVMIVTTVVYLIGIYAVFGLLFNRPLTPELILRLLD